MSCGRHRLDASAAMTLDVYADLFESDLDAVAENVGTACSVALIFDTGNGSTCTESDVLLVPSVRFELTLHGF